MQIKLKGLNIEYKQGELGFLLTEDAVKEFCEYNKIPFDDKDIYTNGAVATKKLAIHMKMVYEFSKIATNNNWRKRHGIPMRRKIDSKRS